VKRKKGGIEALAGLRFFVPVPMFSHPVNRSSHFSRFIEFVHPGQQLAQLDKVSLSDSGGGKVSVMDIVTDGTDRPPDDLGSLR